MQDSVNQSTRGGTTIAPTCTLVTIFKPRQLLLNSNSKMKHHQPNDTKTPFSLSDDQRILLFQSVCQFFQKSGFSKSLKKFTKEAHIEKESWKSCLLDLEEMCYHFLKMRNETKVSENAIKEQSTSQKDGCINHVVSVETTKKPKKNDDGDEGKKSNGQLEDTPTLDVKPKKKKKSKSASDSSEQIAEENHMKPSNEPGDVFLSVSNELGKKSKDKKKRKEEFQEDKKEETAGLTSEETLEQADVSQNKKKEKSRSKKMEKDDSKNKDTSVENKEADNEKKISKKRKKSSEENENGDVEKEMPDDSKRRKTDNFNHSNETLAPKTPNGSSNGILENDGGKESRKKDRSKQLNQSAESTAAKAFRRVKEEEVEFVDERLQDNSYWAKDGAESGYGAKAQEVLGQVRGRGFRHEKTKKKRGTYRGGQIDLQSHSIKFNYDDDDE